MERSLDNGQLIAELRLIRLNIITQCSDPHIHAACPYTFSLGAEERIVDGCNMHRLQICSTQIPLGYFCSADVYQDAGVGWIAEELKQRKLVGALYRAAAPRQAHTSVVYAAAGCSKCS